MKMFYTLRIGKSTHDFRIFKKIFLNRDRWINFNANVQDTVSEASEEVPGVDEYRRKYPEETEDIMTSPNWLVEPQSYRIRRI